MDQIRYFIVKKTKILRGEDAKNDGRRDTTKGINQVLRFALVYFRKKGYYCKVSIAIWQFSAAIEAAHFPAVFEMLLSQHSKKGPHSWGRP